MAQTGFTPISTYYTTTAAAVPTAGNLVNGELALNINTADGKLFYKDSAGVVQVLASRDANAGNFTNISVSGVASFADGTVSLPSITNIGDTNTGIFFPAADTIAFTEGGVESMRIDSAGNVGIGIDNPVTRLVVRGIAGQAAAIITVPSTGTTVRSNNTFRIQSEASGRDVYMQFSDNIANSTEIGMISGAQYFCTGAVERMRITNAGNVGIGANDPVARLEVVDGFVQASTSFTNNTGQAGYNLFSNRSDNTKPRGQLLVNGSSYASSYQAIRANTMVLYSAYADLAINADTNNNIQFWTGSNERMRINSSGNLLVGTTTPIQGASTFNNGNSVACVFYRPSSTSNQSITSFFSDLGGTATFKGYVDTNGTYVNLSDERYKKNVEQLNSGIDIVSQLNPVSFNWLNEEEAPKTVGFIAQEVESVYPQAVTTFDASDSNGFADQKMMKNDALFPLLVKAIQEQQAMIETLTTRLNALEGK